MKRREREGGREKKNTKMKQSFRFAGCQIPVVEDKETNVRCAISAISSACRKTGAKVVALPEMFSTPYDTKKFPVFAESIPGPTSVSISEAAKTCGCYVIAGSIPERDGSRVYNTCVCFAPDGSIVAKHRKLHLFEVETTTIRFHESETLTAGSDLTSFETPFGTIGVAICFDIRFPEVSRSLAIDRGCGFLVFPGAFNMTTGPAHWKLLVRARAVDNQCYVAAVAPSRDTTASSSSSSSYVSWAHSLIVDPWGTVASAAGDGPEVISAVIDHEKIQITRRGLPVLSGLRTELYDTWRKK